MNQKASKMLRKLNETMNGNPKTLKKLKKDYNSWTKEKKNELKKLLEGVH